MVARCVCGLGKDETGSVPLGQTLCIFFIYWSDVCLCFQSKQQDQQCLDRAARALRCPRDTRPQQQQPGGDRVQLLPSSATQEPVCVLVAPQPCNSLHICTCFQNSDSLFALTHRFLNNNRISVLKTSCFANLSNSLQVLRLNRNRLSTIPAKIFQLSNLLHL